MSLSKERLEEEIKATQETIKKLIQIQDDSITGVRINEIVLSAFEKELTRF